MIWLGLLVAASLTLVLTPPLIRELRRRAIIDTPLERSSHVTPTPRGGGLAPAIATIVGLVVAVGFSKPWLLAIAAIASAFGALGFVDDVRALSAGHRPAVQVVVAAVAVIPLLADSENRLNVVIAAPFVWLWLIAFVNAFNFMDGINGISTAQVVIAGTAWGVVGLWKDERDLVAGGLIVAAAALAFLPFNFPHARVFLGDVGSYFFGGWLAALAFASLSRSATFEMALAPLSLYAGDTALTLARRVMRGVRWTQAHREHVYQRLVIAGWSHARTTGYVSVLVTMSCLLGAATMSGDTAVRVGADVAVAMIVLIYVCTPWLVARQPPRTRAD